MILDQISTYLMNVQKNAFFRRSRFEHFIFKRLQSRSTGRLYQYVMMAGMLIGASASLAQSTHNDENEGPRQGDLQVQHDTELTRLWSYGWDHYRNKRYAHVPEYFWKVARLDTTHRFKQLYNYLGVSYYALGKLDSAQLAYELGVQIFPDDFDLRRNLAYVFSMRDQIAPALAAYEQIEQRAALTSQDLRRMAPLYLRLRQETKAIQTFERLLALEPADESVRQTLMSLYKSHGEEYKMLQSMEEIVARHPEDRQALFALAQARLERQEPETALPLLQRYCALDSGDAYARELVGRAQQRLGRYREALASYAAVLKLQQQPKRIWVEISQCHRALHEFAAARDAAQKALHLDANDGEALMALGQAYEACAEACATQKGRRDFNDKLVYRMAYDQYQLARQDINTRGPAQQRMAYLQALLPTREDEFMNKRQDRPQGECYSWLNE